MRRAIPVLVGGLLLCSAALAADASTPPFVGPRISHPARTPDFALRDQNGHVIRLSAQRGKVVVLTFLYTHCPDLCPLTAVHIDEAVSRLGAERSDVRVLAVSVDPKRDTPAAVRGFIRSHRLGPEFHYLTGPRRVLAPLWRKYDVKSVSIGVQPSRSTSTTRTRTPLGT